jgi:hypothetical protein
VKAAAQLEVAADGVAVSVEESKDAAAIEKEIKAKEEAVKKAEAATAKVSIRFSSHSLPLCPLEDAMYYLSILFHSRLGLPSRIRPLCPLLRATLPHTLAFHFLLSHSPHFLALLPRLAPIHPRDPRSLSSPFSSISPFPPLSRSLRSPHAYHPPTSLLSFKSKH